MQARTLAKKSNMAKVCVSVIGKSITEMAKRADEALSQGADLVEFRLDFLLHPIQGNITDTLQSYTKDAILTVRPPEEGGAFLGKEPERIALLERLADLNPSYLDIELRTLRKNQHLADRLADTEKIVSWHDLKETPSPSELLGILTEAQSHGGLPKIICTARSPADNLSILALYDHMSTVIAFCMGELGILSRVAAIELGSPISYASLPDRPVADGQLTLGQMLALRRRISGA